MLPTAAGYAIRAANIHKPFRSVITFVKNGKGTFVWTFSDNARQKVYEKRAEICKLYRKPFDILVMETEVQQFVRDFGKMTNNKNWRLVGLPFYNETNTKNDFEEKFKSVLI
jgi:hypothetical protein